MFRDDVSVDGGGIERTFEIARVIVRVGAKHVADCIDSVAGERQVFLDRPHASLGALTPTEFAMLKGPEMQTPHKGEKIDRLYL